MNGVDSWSINNAETIWENSNQIKRWTNKTVPLIAMLRVRNEELILEDTLDHLSGFADLIVAYEDASTDRTRNILRTHPKVALTIENNIWLNGIEDRLLSETRHRGLLLKEARKRWDFRWCMCCDADERYIGEISTFVNNWNTSQQPDAIQIKLFDAYMTPTDMDAYSRGRPLLNFRKYFGPECRRIIMLWRNTNEVTYRGLDSREPCVPGNIAVQFFCQHYGKSLSIDHWDATCDYYLNHFPYHPYGEKWQARKGKAIHDLSDFGRPLYTWGDELFRNMVLEF
jgi:glycosyltransferase involved in cell wall biosynthesis